MKCIDCGREIKTPYNGLCQSCYNYYRNGGIVNELPPKGMIKKDERGYVICHICGKSYKKLGGHAAQNHGMSIEMYKETFGLCRNARTTEDNYSNVMSNFAYQYKMPEMLIEKGVRTRLTSTSNTHKRQSKIARNN